ncbi:MAG: ATP-binding protein [Chloroflexota bacterium]
MSRLLETFWKPRSLSTKLLLPIAGLMLVALLASSFAFVVSTAATRNRILQQQILDDQQRITQTLSGRVETIRSAAQILASNDEIARAMTDKTDESLSLVDSRAVQVRNRFGLDVIQIYAASGEAWTNLLLASLYRVSSLQPYIQDGETTLVIVDERLLLLSRMRMQSGAGDVIVGIDLETELKRIIAQEGLAADLGLRFQDSEVTILRSPGESEKVRGEAELLLGDSPATLIIAHPVAEINQVTNAGLVVTVASLLLTTLVLIFLSTRVIQSIALPVEKLADVAQSVRRDHQFEPIDCQVFAQNPLYIGQGDELGRLFQDFNTMLLELRDLYTDLEHKVETRTRQVEAASEIARATAASLELDVVLRTAVEMVCQRFGLYFAGVFIIDPRRNVATLREATRQVAQLFDDNRYLVLPLDKDSHIAQAIRSRQVMLVQDVRRAPGYLPHTSLPDSQAEAVFPLIHGEHVIGALDVQSARMEAFVPELVEILHTLADQLAVAIQNASLFEQQKEIATRLTEIDFVKTQFLATVSHELRTPLNSIIGFSKLMLNELDGPITEAQASDLQSIFENGQHLLWIINDMLDLSQMEAGRMGLDLGEVNLGDEIAAALEVIQKRLNSKPIQLRMEVPADLPVLQADGPRLRQVLINLLSNGVKFTNSGIVAATATYNEQWVIVSIEDTGIGIAPEHMDRLFRPFSQIDASSTRKHGGLGLGLIVTRYIIELHGGKIWADSLPGVGSTFSFVLPIQRGQSI